MGTSDSNPAFGPDGTVYVGSGDNLYAVNPNGTVEWSYAAGGFISSSPAVGSDWTIYVGSANGELYAINPNGTLKWSYPTGGRIDYSSPAVGADGTIYVGASNNNLMTSTVYAINPNGTLQWSSAFNGKTYSSPAVGADGTLYVKSLYGLFAISSNSFGLAISSWPMFHHDVEHTGRFVFPSNALLAVVKLGDGTGTVTSSPAGINCGGICSASYVPGTSVTLTPAPEVGSAFAGWSGCNSTSGNTCIVNMTTSRYVTCTFTSVQRTLTATLQGTGSGALSAEGLSCSGNTCTGKYSYGTTVNINATPNECSAFAGWTGCDSTNGTVCTVVMTTNKSVTATFEFSPNYTLTATRIGTGTGTIAATGLSCSGQSCTGVYPCNTQVTLTATADNDSVFMQLTGCDSANKNICSVGMNANKTVTATFNTLVGAVQLPRTGQTKCYNSYGTEISCVGTGQDGEIRAGIGWPTPRFTVPDNCPESVIDELTGLMWFDVPLYGDSIYFWGGALSFTTTFESCGYTDWRVPNVNELESLIHSGEPDQAQWLESQGFAQIPIYCASITNCGRMPLWSSTTYAKYSSSVWQVSPFDGGGYYNNGGVFWEVKSEDYNPYYDLSSGVFMVRSTTGPPSQLWRTGQVLSYSLEDDGYLQTGAAWPTPRFIDQGNGTVADMLTGLIWTKDAGSPGPPQCNPKNYQYNWQDALDLVKCLNTHNFLGHNDWRLPNRKELLSLVDRSQYIPALPQGHPFTNVKSGPDPGDSRYWSSTTREGLENYAWCLDMYGGSLEAIPKPNYVGYVWPVRGGISVFSDVPLGYWAYDYINAIYNAHITTGYADGRYGPEDLVAREQMAAFIIRAKEGEPPSNYCETGIPFPDVSSDMWSCRYIKKLYELGITTGYSDGRYGPYDQVLREQMAAFLVRAVEGEPPLNYCDSGSLFPDVTPDMWSCIYIKRLKELEITTGYGDGRYGPYDLVTRAQMAAFLSRAFLGME